MINYRGIMGASTTKQTQKTIYKSIVSHASLLYVSIRIVQILEFNQFYYIILRSS